MTNQMIDDIYDYCVEAGISLVCTSANGETTMFPKWHEDLSGFLDHPQFMLQINSNFVREFSEDDLLALNKHHKIQISIDSSSPALMKEQRTADMRTILSNVVRLKQTMLKTGKKTVLDINCTVTRKNITHIADLARLALLLEVDALVVTEMFAASANPNMPDGIKDLTDEEAAQFTLSVTEAINILQGTKTKIQVRPGLITKLVPILDALNSGKKPSADSLRKEDNVGLDLGPCMQPWTTVIVVASGEVRTCSDKAARSATSKSRSSSTSSTVPSLATSGRNCSRANPTFRVNRAGRRNRTRTRTSSRRSSAHTPVTMPNT